MLGFYQFMSLLFPFSSWSKIKALRLFLFFSCSRSYIPVHIVIICTSDPRTQSIINLYALPCLLSSKVPVPIIYKLHTGRSKHYSTFPLPLLISCIYACTHVRDYMYVGTVPVYQPTCLHAYMPTYIHLHTPTYAYMSLRTAMPPTYLLSQIYPHNYVPLHRPPFTYVCRGNS
ncbi:hypothetical protein F4814DRAFT_82339 [Daldinia grandis]|nr:hypothetical protein F4814DRAFT_82339 [Daldinia grandis]